MSIPSGAKFIASPAPRPKKALPFEIWLRVNADCAIVAGCLLETSITVCPILQWLVFVANAVKSEKDSNTGAWPGIIKWSWYQRESKPNFSASTDREIISSKGDHEML